MLRILLVLGCLGLAACGDGQSLFPDEDGDGVPDDGGDDGTGDGDGVTGDPDLPPGTDAPSADAGITRFEADDAAGGGYVQSVSYDAGSDTFTVDNLAFDGDNVYTRDDDVGTLSDGRAVYAVYEASNVELDDDGDAIGQFDYRAIYGVSANADEDGDPATRFAIVRTGSYVDYGFGGFVYERAGGVELPTSGQATYAGDYAGLRVFDGRGGLEYTRGDVDIAVDFRDFNDGAGVAGAITDREAFDLNGNPIPLGGEGGLVLPPLTFDVGPGVLTGNGEITGSLASRVETEAGALEAYEQGTYYAIVAGEDASEIVGVFVVESQDPRFEGVTAQETGGFIVYR